MESGHDFDTLKILKLSAHARDSFANLQEIAEGSVSHYDDHLGPHRGDLAEKKRSADRSFFQRWLPVTGRPATIDVADDYVFAFQANRFDDLGKQLSGAAHKRFALRVFIGTGRLADKH